MSTENLQPVRGGRTRGWSVPKPVGPEITEADETRFFSIVSTSLSPEQVERVVTPSAICPKQQTVLAVHWHPEFVDTGLIARRIGTMFPNNTNQLTIPTQHNVLMNWGDYTGVEVDCYSKSFNQKVQLLLHFRNERLAEAHTMRAMIEHTRKYRATQLLDFIHTIIRSVGDRIARAAVETGADEMLVSYVGVHVNKVNTLLDLYWDRVPPEFLRNKLLNNWFDALRQRDGDGFIDRAQTYLRAVKGLVKAAFPPGYFYRTREIIEEARNLGAGIVIPHPEQFWPVLMAEYDVDGWEVWNPQSRRYTEFLVDVLNEKNRSRCSSRPPLLAFMGDDTHFGEKIKDPAHQDKLKAEREVGVQPWDDMTISKRLIMADMSRERLLAEYRARLDA